MTEDEVEEIYKRGIVDFNFLLETSPSFKAWYDDLRATMLGPDHEQKAKISDSPKVTHLFKPLK